MNTQNNRPAPSITEPTMTSLEISEISGVPHADLLKSIRKQEAAWQKVTKGNFFLSEYKDASGKKNPMYKLTQRECLFIGTKFNDEARARLIVEFENLKKEKAKVTFLEERLADYPEDTIITVAMGKRSNQVYKTKGVVFAKLGPIAKVMGYMDSPTNHLSKFGKENILKLPIGKREAWFISATAFDQLVKIKGDVPFDVISTIFKDCFGIAKTKDDGNPYTHHYTDSEVLELINAINQRPINKNRVLDLLLKGKAV